PKKIRRRPRVARASSAWTWARSWSGSGRVSAGALMGRLFHAIEGEVQLQHVDAWLAEYAEPGAPGMGGDEAAYPLQAQVPDAGDANRLIVGRREADVGVEAAGGGGDQIDRDRSSVQRVGGPQSGDARLNRLGQCGVEGAQVGAAGGEAIVGLRAGRGRPAPEVLRIAEGLADQPRSHRLAVFRDEAAGGLRGKQGSRHTGNRQRIRDASDDGQYNEQGDGGSQYGVSRRSIARPFLGPAPAVTGAALTRLDCFRQCVHGVVLRSGARPRAACRSA